MNSGKKLRHTVPLRQKPQIFTQMKYFNILKSPFWSHRILANSATKRIKCFRINYNTSHSEKSNLKFTECAKCIQHIFHRNFDDTSFFSRPTVKRTLFFHAGWTIEFLANGCTVISERSKTLRAAWPEQSDDPRANGCGDVHWTAIVADEQMTVLQNSAQLL